MDAPVDSSPAGWRSARGEASLADVHRSIAVRASGPGWRRAAAFVGPGYLVAVGYMDPGNWATSLAGGSKFGYALLVVALLCCGINSTVTATLAGQIVMEGFLKIRLAPWLRRLITRAIAIVPAAAVTIWYGDAGTAKLLILTQVMLSLQLSFAVFPLVMFTADRAKMGELVAPRWLTAFATLIAVVIAALNVKLLVDFVSGAS